LFGRDPAEAMADGLAAFEAGRHAKRYQRLGNPKSETRNPKQTRAVKIRVHRTQRPDEVAKAGSSSVMY
jgi:hypothetical protein